MERATASEGNKRKAIGIIDGYREKKFPQREWYVRFSEEGEGYLQRKKEKTNLILGGLVAKRRWARSYLNSQGKSASRERTKKRIALGDMKMKNTEKTRRWKTADEEASARRKKKEVSDPTVIFGSKKRNALLSMGEGVCEYAGLREKNCGIFERKRVLSGGKKAARVGLLGVPILEKNRKKGAVFKSSELRKVTL